MNIVRQEWHMLLRCERNSAVALIAYDGDGHVNIFYACCSRKIIKNRQLYIDILFLLHPTTTIRHNNRIQKIV